MFGTRNVTILSKGLLPAGFAMALAAGIFVAPASAGSLADYYRTMYTLKFCNMAAESEEVSETEEEQNIRLPVDQEFIDLDATSEDVAPIFDQLNTEYNNDPVTFCEQNTAAAQEVVDETN